MGETHLITGGTGFVGSAVILELLRQTDADVVALVRPAGGSPRERLLEALGHAVAVYEADDELLEAIEHRCHEVGGDLGEPRCGVDPAALPPIRSVWHCAASLRYEDRYAREIFATNLDRTRQALALAERVGVSGSFRCWTCIRRRSPALPTGCHGSTSRSTRGSRSTSPRLPSCWAGEPDDNWVQKVAATIRPGRSVWRTLPAAERDRLERACAPGFAALAQHRERTPTTPKLRISKYTAPLSLR